MSEFRVEREAVHQHAAHPVIHKAATVSAKVLHEQAANRRSGYIRTSDTFQLLRKQGAGLIAAGVKTATIHAFEGTKTTILGEHKVLAHSLAGAGMTGKVGAALSKGLAVLSFVDMTLSKATHPKEIGRVRVADVHRVEESKKK